MKTTLDRFGRLVVPKDIRNRLGLRPGAEVELDEHGNEIILKPVEREAPLIMEQGILVYAGAATGDIAEAVRTHRHDRLQHVAARKRS